MANILYNNTIQGITASTETDLLATISDTGGRIIQSLRISNRDASASATITVKIKTSATIDWQSVPYVILAEDEAIVIDRFDGIIIKNGQSVTVESDEADVSFILSTSLGLTT